jgi:8-oxo-dGTP diphosphatase
VHSVGVSGVISNASGDVLLVRTARAGWELPGGRVEAAEDLFQALQRECREEAGCDVQPGRLTGVYAHIRQDLLILVFGGRSNTVQPRPSSTEDKVREAAWFSPEQALSSVTHVREREALADGLAFAGDVAYRVYR